MEWPAHQLLRQCERAPDVETGSSCSSKCCHAATKELEKSYNTSSCDLSCVSLSPKRFKAGEPGPHTTKPCKLQSQRKWTYSRLNGWYVLTAEILGTIILIALCVVAANQARSMSEEVDTVALAALARSNSRAICVNASTDNVQGRIIQGVNLQLVPSSFRDSSGRYWKRAGLEAGLRSPSGLWNFPLTCQTIPIDSAFTQNMLAAMYHCGIIKGGYHSQDLPPYISRGCSQCHAELRASLNSSAAVNTTFAPNADINTARAQPALESKLVQYRLARVLNTTLLSESGQLLNPSSLVHSEPTSLSWTNGSTSLLMFSKDDFLPGLDALPRGFDVGYDTSRDYLVMPNMGMPTFQGMETSLYMSEDLWHEACGHNHHRHLDPRAVPTGTLRVDVFHTPPPSFLEYSQTSKGQHVSSVWLELSQQTAKTAHCMAESATLAVNVLQHAKYSLRHANGTTLHNVRPKDYNLTFDQLWLRLDANLDAARPYACAEGVDVTSADATAYLTRLDAYKSTAKSQYRTTIFVSMHHQTAEDIYAVYTGALGAVFGSMALLVSTLFVYVLAAVQHAVWHRHLEDKPD